MSGEASLARRIRSEYSYRASASSGISAAGSLVAAAELPQGAAAERAHHRVERGPAGPGPVDPYEPAYRYTMSGFRSFALW